MCYELMMVFILGCSAFVIAVYFKIHDMYVIVHKYVSWSGVDN